MSYVLLDRLVDWLVGWLAGCVAAWLPPKPLTHPNKASHTAAQVRTVSVSLTGLAAS